MCANFSTCRLFDLSACRFVGKSESWRVSGARRFLGLPRGKTSAAVVWLVCRWVVAGQETRGGGGAVYPAGKREEWGRAADTGWRIQAGGERAGLGGGGRGGEYRVGGLAALGLPGGKREGSERRARVQGGGGGGFLLLPRGKGGRGAAGWRIQGGGFSRYTGGSGGVREEKG